MKAVQQAGPAAATEWQERAACARVEPDLFFPERSDSVTRETRRVCWDCPVRAECLAHALANDETDGLWGGLTPRERRQLRTPGPVR
ncbi:WhiB family transcriptional regulator [Streptomyces sp. NPDC012950]|uniref:WhiB family transcriptional regulator n=1 Tax=Streptomyces sp. NPDC012950 TaxID=3364858 RepID=UPI0036A473EB